MEYFDDIENLEKLEREINELNRYAVEIGVFGSDDSFYQMIATVHEFGMQIKAKNKYLAIPTKEAGEKRPKDFGDKLFKPKGKNILALANRDGTLTTMFILKESVNIPERSFIRSTFDENERDWAEFIENQIEKVLSLEITARQLFERLGALIVGDIQKKMTDLRTPANASLTVANKGSSNPLIDTGELRRHVTWKVVRDDG
ncbi:hypothetical protein D1953_07000 [Peribacillus asahii]|uniref:Uncharacterized protein n=1 Tax=Peribacillus asahii TaxID=228899 RepID=A0A398BE17_9BACI|nr:hypothetical protein [Peribacillus asahii]RID87058.1 hypothetical protein D1953_07000 [Peribacillus asahii]